MYALQRLGSTCGPCAIVAQIIPHASAAGRDDFRNLLSGSLANGPRSTVKSYWLCVVAEVVTIVMGPGLFYRRAWIASWLNRRDGPMRAPSPQSLDEVECSCILLFQ